MVNQEQILNKINSSTTKPVNNPIPYEYTDVIIKCHACGHEQVLVENLMGGIRYDMYPTDQHGIILACENCNNKIEFSFRSAANPPAKVEAQEIEVEEAEINTAEDEEPVLEESETQA